MSNNPISFRPTDDDLKTINRIIATNDRPGLNLKPVNAIRIALAEWATNHPEEKMDANRLAKDTVCYLENPWSGTVSQMTWGEIKQWSRENVHESARKEWLEEAQKAAKTGDSKTLGIMIIGS